MSSFKTVSQKSLNIGSAIKNHIQAHERKTKLFIQMLISNDLLLLLLSHTKYCICIVPSWNTLYINSELSLISVMLTLHPTLLHVTLSRTCAGGRCAAAHQGHPEGRLPAN